MASEEVILNLKTNGAGAAKDINKVGAGAKGAAKETTLLGMAMGGVRKAMLMVKTTSKLLFGSIKAGLISTGIGAFVVIIGSLISYFMNTKAGAEKLEQAFAAIGAAIAVITDRISQIGGAIAKVFSGDFKGAIEDVKGAMTGIGDEIIAEANAAMRLKAELQELADATRGFNIEKAQTRQEIAKALLMSEDETLSNEQRLEGLKEAMRLEEENSKRELELQQRRVLAIEEEVALGESLNEDLDKLAQERIRLVDMETASIKLKRKVLTEVNAFEIAIASERKSRSNARKKRKEAEAKAAQKVLDDAKKAADKQAAIDKKAADDAQKVIDDALEAKEKAIEESAAKLYELQRDNTLLAIDDMEERAEKAMEFAEKEEIAAVDGMENSEALKTEIRKKYGKFREDVAKAEAATEMALETQKLEAVGSVLGQAAGMATEGTAGWKALKMTEAMIGMITGAQQAYNSMVGIPVVGPFLAPVSAGLALAAGMKSMDTIANTPIPEPPQTAARGGVIRGYGNGSSDSIPARLSRGEVVINSKSARAFRPLLSSINTAGGGIGFARGGATSQDIGSALKMVTPETPRAYVITDDMSNSQDRLNKIRRKASL